MKTKVEDASGAALDWLVAKAKGIKDDCIVFRTRHQVPSEGVPDALLT